MVKTLNSILVLSQIHIKKKHHKKILIFVKIKINYMNICFYNGHPEYSKHPVFFRGTQPEPA